MWCARKNKENSTDGTVHSLQQSRFESQCCSDMQVNFSQKHDWNLKLNFHFLSFFTLKKTISRTSFREVWFYFQKGEVKRLMQNPMGGKAWMLRDFLRTLRVRLHKLGSDSWSWVYSSLSFTWDRETKTKAQGLLANLKTFGFISTFFIT